MSKILSVTIPTYNVEKYLKQCLDSFIIPEIIDDMEILIVNDGSTDSSPIIAKEYTEKYPDTFKLINNHYMEKFLLLNYYHIILCKYKFSI